MKQLFHILLLLLTANIAVAQAPQGIPYQAAARNSSGAILASTAISVRFTIRDSIATGVIKYRETHSVTTTAQGMFSVNVGQGTVVSGTFAGINWATNAKFMQMEMDPAGGGSYIDMGTSQMMSVPYALYAGSTGNGGWNITGNAGLNPATNFIGTTDTNSLRFRVNNTWSGELNASSDNTSYGLNAAQAITTGYNNTATGSASLAANTTGYSNTAIGYQSLYANTTGSQNVAIGVGSLFANTTGGDNTANGMWSLNFNTSGYNNTANGSGALFVNTTGSDNTANGKWSLASNTTGIDNVASGSGSLFNNTTGYYNSAIGFVSLSSNTTGNENTAMGRNSLATNTTGNNNTALGNFADVSTGTLNNAMALGNSATVNASNKVVVGGTSVTVIGGQVGWSTLSDGRFKSQIQENVPGLDFILKLKPVTYRFEARKFEHFLGRPDSLIQQLSNSYDLAESEVRTGFIAQEVESAAKKIGYDFSGIHKPQNDKDNYSLAYAEFTVPIVKAIQEQQQKISDQQLLIEKLLSEIRELKSRMTAIEKSK